MALFSNQRYELGPKALIPTYSQVVSIKPNIGLSNLKYYTSMWSVKGIRIAFQVYLLLKDMGGPEKDRVFVSVLHNPPRFLLFIFFLPAGFLLA